MNEEKINKAVQDAISAKDSFNDCTLQEQQEVIRRVCGIEAVEEIMRLISFLQKYYR